MASFHRVPADPEAEREARSRRRASRVVASGAARQRPSIGVRGVPPRTLVILWDDDGWIIDEACVRARSAQESELYILVVGGSNRTPAADVEREVLHLAATVAWRYGIRLAPLAPTGNDVAEAVCIAAEEIDARVVIMKGVERRGLVGRLRGRRILGRVRRRLSSERRLILYE
ncbi:MAG: hypothetical protein QOD06_236 [Candidatus Binatota bacterium]|jgi:nucleotide-binding universal stress UspA family protein|nr:hypothetical protein [Candidatus Binatota bacterium]